MSSVSVGEGHPSGERGGGDGIKGRGLRRDEILGVVNVCVSYNPNGSGSAAEDSGSLGELLIVRSLPAVPAGEFFVADLLLDGGLGSLRKPGGSGLWAGLVRSFLVGPRRSACGVLL